MKYVLLYTLLFLYSTEYIQAQDYSLEIDSVEYTEIQDYQSLQILTFGNLSEYVFKLPFSFPFFDERVDSLIYDRTGTFSVSNRDNFSIRPFVYLYQWDIISDTFDIKSDIRYKYGSVADLEYFVCQHTHLRLDPDSSVEEFDSHIDYQVWFWSDGTIDLVMGHYDLANSPHYVPGSGFWFPGNEGPIFAGPELSINHPSDFSRGVSYVDSAGASSAHLISEPFAGEMKYLQPPGTRVRFLPAKQTKTDNLIAGSASMAVYPNPATDQLYIGGLNDCTIGDVLIFNNLGQLVLATSYEDPNHSINVGGIGKGLYTLHLNCDANIKVCKFIKN